MMKMNLSIKSAEEARQEAINWQQWQAEQSLGWAEVAEWQSYFGHLGELYGLTDEFKEEGII